MNAPRTTDLYSVMDSEVSASGVTAQNLLADLLCLRLSAWLLPLFDSFILDLHQRLLIPTYASARPRHLTAVSCSSEAQPLRCCIIFVPHRVGEIPSLPFIPLGIGRPTRHRVFHMTSGSMFAAQPSSDHFPLRRYVCLIARAAGTSNWQPRF